MSAEGAGYSELERAIASVYGGPLEEFVRRRDGLARELRAAGRREDATAVMGLRKPARLAWALDAAALDGQGTIERLVAAVAATLEAQASGGDVRGAIGALRGAVRDFAGHAARAATERGQRVEETALANAVLAVIAQPNAFDALRGGCLVDIPVAGGLDFLTSLPQPTAPVPRPAKPAPSPERAGTEAGSRDALRRAGIVLAAARERSAGAHRALDEFESNLASAEERLRQVEQEARVLRGQRDRARQEVEAAAAQLIDAESAAADAERAVSQTGTV